MVSVEQGSQGTALTAGASHPGPLPTQGSQRRLRSHSRLCQPRHQPQSVPSARGRPAPLPPARSLSGQTRLFLASHRMDAGSLLQVWLLSLSTTSLAAAPAAACVRHPALHNRGHPGGRVTLLALCPPTMDTRFPPFGDGEHLRPSSGPTCLRCPWGAQGAAALELRARGGVFHRAHPLSHPPGHAAAPDPCSPSPGLVV